MANPDSRFFLGIDVGSISTNLAVIDGEKNLVESIYIRTDGKPVESVQNGIRLMREKLGEDLKISGAGATGSARQLTGVIVGADVVKNEITAHASQADRPISSNHHVMTGEHAVTRCCDVIG